MRLKEENAALEAQVNKMAEKMKKRDDSVSMRKKDDRKPVSYNAQKGCKGLDCFFNNEEED